MHLLSSLVPHRQQTPDPITHDSTSYTTRNNKAARLVEWISALPHPSPRSMNSSEQFMVMPTGIAAEKYPLEGRDLQLVTRDEIVKSISIAPEIRLCEGAPSVARVTSSAVVKWGRHIHLSEARNMQYVIEHTQIRLPTVIDAWEVDDMTEGDEFNTCYILMEYINGKVLIDIWDELDEKAQRGIQSQIYEYICQLQNLHLKTPGPFGGGISEDALFTGYGAGPFESPKDLEAWYNDRLLVCHDYGRATHLSPGAFSGKFNELVMCHLDLNQRNVLLDDEGKIWLIDWASAEAYPPWFEKAQLAWGASSSWRIGLLELIGKEVHQDEIDQLLAIGFALTTGGYAQPRARSVEDIVGTTISHP
ncbi:uncharacterized protein PAC_18343 [Phialocephala subalpina]|uniref:Aminoglycoside phosphotransferase domain-containing protein n=1 Tax=Phialocephala subalpina TaxID=576137 RepID=A0A1L7XTT6_9HELO|nr:uncharacterized protein PAC_18343 [Phialocephala subalpina]